MRALLIIALGVACRTAPEGPPHVAPAGMTRDDLRSLEIAAACAGGDLGFAERARDQALAKMHKDIDDYLAAAAVFGKDEGLKAEIRAAAARCREDAGWRGEATDGGLVWVK